MRTLKVGVWLGLGWRLWGLGVGSRAGLGRVRGGVGQRSTCAGRFVLIGVVPLASVPALRCRSAQWGAGAGPGTRRWAAGTGHSAAGGLFYACRVHSPEFFFEVGDFVAEAARQFELEFSGRVHHLVGELLDEVGEFCSGHALEVSVGQEACGASGVPAAPVAFLPRLALRPEPPISTVSVSSASA